MCVFCDIIKGDIPCYKIYEDENTIAFLDIANDVYGHTLVIPKKHYQNLIDIPVEELNNVMKSAKKLSEHFVKNCGFTGVNLINCCGKDAEQSVFHFHIHIIPRKNEDNLKIYPILKKSEFDLKEIQEKLKIV